MLALVIVAVLGGLACVMMRSNDREFHGKPESFWINSITNSGNSVTNQGWRVLVTNSASGAKFIYPTWQGFGSEGVPLLLKALRKGSGPWDRLYFKLWPKLPSFLSGWLPKPVDDSVLRQRSVMILSGMGSDAQIAVPAVVRALHDENDRVRQSALFTLDILLPGMGQEKIQILPRVLEATRDGAAGVRNNAVILLGYYSDQASMVVQVVANALNDSDLLVRSGAMRSILRLNAQGANKPVVAALLKLLQDGNAEVRTAASNALRRIDHEAAAKTGVK